MPAVEPTYKKGDIVRCRPHWPNKPAFGIWTRDTVLTTEGRIARVTRADAWEYEGVTWESYTVQFDPKGDGSFYDCHWVVRADEIVCHWDEELECEGHPAGPSDPMGQTVYCDGSCRS